jgi:hypothetical protein
MESLRGIVSPQWLMRPSAPGHTHHASRHSWPTRNLAAQLVAIRQSHLALPLTKAVYVLAADHGITADGVSAYPNAVMNQMALNFVAEGAAVKVLACLYGVAVYVAHVGVHADLNDMPGLLHGKVSRGTKGMLRVAELKAAVNNAGVIRVVLRSTLCGFAEQTSWTLRKLYSCTHRFGQQRLQEGPG